MHNPAARKKFSGNEILRDLIPLNALTPERFREVSASLSIEDISAGSYLFGEGDRDNRSIYLLDGVISLIDASGRVTGAVSAGTEPARYPLANQQPRMTTARAATKAVIATIDSTLLDVLLTLDQSPPPESPVTYADSGEDWMTPVLQSEAFIKLAPADIQQLLQALQPVTVSEGEVIIRQGDEGDYFYIIKEGSCSVTRLASSEGWDVPLAELGKGDCFGEEALVSDATRNASVRMLSDGILMRLSKQDFVELLKKPLVHYVDYDQAGSIVADGGEWLDVRTPDEHVIAGIGGSTSLPLSSIRDRAGSLDTGKPYVLYCDTGRRSAAAAFLLSQRGLDVLVLEGGLNRGAPHIPATLEETAQGLPEPAEVLSLAEPGPARGAEATGAGDSDGERLEELRAAVEALQLEFSHYEAVVQRMEAARAEEHAARQALTDRMQHLFGRLERFNRDGSGTR